MNPIAFGVLFGITVFGGSSINHLERDMARELGDKVQGEHKTVQVRTKLGFESAWGVVPRVSVRAANFTCDALPFKSEPWRSHYGRVRRFELYLQNFSLRKLRFESMNLDISNARFDLAYALSAHRFRISGGGNGPMSAVLKYDDMVRFAASKYPQLQNISIVPAAPGIEIRGDAQIGPFKAAFKVKGIPAVRHGTEIYLSDPSVEVNSKPVDAATAAGFLKGFSSFMDLDRDLGAGGSLEIDSFKVEPDDLICIGKVRIPEAVSPPKNGLGIELPVKTVDQG